MKDRTTSWIHYANRYYNTTTGTWTQQDDLDAPLDPTNGNRYAYAGGDPINNTDPTGRSAARCLSSAQIFAGGLGGLAAAGVGVVSGGLSTPASYAVGAASLGVVGGAINAGLNCNDDEDD